MLKLGQVDCKSSETDKESKLFIAKSIRRLIKDDPALFSLNVFDGAIDCVMKSYQQARLQMHWFLPASFAY